MVHNHLHLLPTKGLKRKGAGGRLVSRGRIPELVGTTFVSGSHEISEALVAKVSNKACQFVVTFQSTEGGNEHYYGQGGFIRGERLSPPDDTCNSKKRRKTTRRVQFSEFANFGATPVTAKHNVESCDDERYLRTTVKFADGYETDIIMPDGGCILQGEEEIEVRAATEECSAITWVTQDDNFGKKLENPANSLTKGPRLFQKVPESFNLRVGLKIGMTAFRTFDITHKDAKTPGNVRLEDFYGEKLQACVYTGKVTEISTNGQSFCHDINAFEGCSGAVIFLLDRNQTIDVEAQYHGMAVGVHVGGLDLNNNIAFMLQ